MSITSSSTTDNGPLFGASIAWVVISGIVLGLRLVTRKFIVNSLGWDDALMCIAFLASIGVSITMIEQINGGMNTEHPNELKLNKAFWASVWTYNTSLIFTKISILVSYFRIFIQKQLRLICWIILAFLVLFGLWTILGTFFVCVPLSKAWTTFDIHGNAYCQNRFIAWFFNAATHLVLDITLIFLPMPVLKGLNMPAKQKIALMFIFALGSFVCVMSAIRLYFLVEMEHNDNNAATATWSVIETNVGIVCASLPSLKALVSWVWPRFGGSKHSFNSRRATATAGTLGLSQHTRNGLEPDFEAFGLKTRYATHTTYVQGGHKSSKSWQDKNKLRASNGGSRGDVGLQTMASIFSRITDAGDDSARETGRRSDEAGIAVTTIIEHEIESENHSLSDSESQRELWRQDSGHSRKKSEPEHMV